MGLNNKKMEMSLDEVIRSNSGNRRGPKESRMDVEVPNRGRTYRRRREKGERDVLRVSIINSASGRGKGPRGGRVVSRGDDKRTNYADIKTDKLSDKFSRTMDR